MGFTINFAGAKDFTPFEGGGDLFPFEGLTHGLVADIKESKAKSGNDMLVFTLVCAEAEAKGLKVKKYVPVTGMRSNGKPNVIGLLEALTSAYSESMPDADAVAKSRALEGQNLDSSVAIGALKGKPVYFEVKARVFQKDDGSSVWSSECSNFSMKGAYIEAKGNNTHHRNLPPNVGQSVAPTAGGGGAFGDLGLGGPSANGVTQQTAAVAPKTGALGII